MSTLDVTRPHSLPISIARSKAEGIAKHFETKLGVRWAWDHDVLRFESAEGMAKGVKGEVSVSPTQVRVQIALPFLLRMMQGTIEGKVHEKLALFDTAEQGNSASA